VRDDDLASFAVADGLLRRIASERPGKLTETEHRHLLDVARENLARGTGETLQMAGRVMFKAADEGEFTVQCGEQFATVTMYGRILVVYSRMELAGRVHPEHTSTVGVVPSPASLLSRWEMLEVGPCRICSTSSGSDAARPAPPPTRS
jgi:hypothetical protein